MVQRQPRELLSALIAVIFITLVYFGMNIILGGIPAASSFYGHSMGIIGFLLMLMTETLYSLRKRSRLARWGQMSTWLQFHIFTGIVGPYLVLLHSSWKFNGVAGVLSLMTAVIVISGFVGRYIYTAVPRTADGLEIEGDELEKQIAIAEGKVRAWASAHKTLSSSLTDYMGNQADGMISDGDVMALNYTALDGQQQMSAWLAKLKKDPNMQKEAREFDLLLRRRNILQRQAASLQTARRLLATWHAIHIPIGLGLFALAFVHIGAAIYYALLLR